MLCKQKKILVVFGVTVADLFFSIYYLHRLVSHHPLNKTMGSLKFWSVQLLHQKQSELTYAPVANRS